MSRHALEAVVGAAILDAKFRLALFADPENALRAYQLTGEEIAALKSVDYESLEACAQHIAKRLTDKESD